MIVVGFIQSKEGLAALDRSIEEARLRSAPLLVVHSRKGGREDPEKVIASREELEAVEQRLVDEGIEHEVVEFVLGNEPSQDLVRVARERGAELIVIGIRHRSPVGKLILGSNAQEILLDADCPVLAVKATEAPA